MPNNAPKPIVLAVIDGWGAAPHWGGNAVSLAKTTFMNRIAKTYPHTTLEASGRAVGLPDHERGNSEVGHLNIGAGQVVNESLPSISAAIEDGSFFQNTALIKAFDQAKAANTAVHLMGLVSDGGIHSHIDHLFALIDMAKQRQSTDIFIHAVTDGRDTPPFVAQEYLSRLNTKLREVGFGQIATVAGRYFAMDRDLRWERVEKIYRAITEGVGPVAESAEGAVAAAYRDGFSDEFIVPTVIHAAGNTFRTLKDGDSFILFNFRGDRAREVSQAIIRPDFDGFSRKIVAKNVCFVGFTFFQEGLPMEVAFRPRDVKEPLAAVLAKAGLKQLHVAESEKYAHVTYFFNGGQEEGFGGEKRIVVPSPKVPSFDQVPEMACDKISQVVIENIAEFDFIILNYAAPDMVGHTGNLRATIKACESVDAGLEQIFKAVQEAGGLLIVTADHGNAEQMVNPKTGEADTEHSNNPVPFLIAGELATKWQLRPKGTLSDVAPTILEILNLDPSSEMTGQSLLLKNQNPITASVDAAASPVAQSIH